MRMAIIATNLETGEERTFNTIRRAADALFISYNAVWSALNGKHKKSGGCYVFRYAEPSVQLSKKQAEIIIKMADCRLNVAETARQLEKHTNTVVYHVQEIVNLTGKDPRDFHGMCELLPMAKAILQERENDSRGTMAI